MVKDLFSNNIFIYVIAGLFVLGVIAKLIVWISYKGLIRKSRKMATSNSKLLQTIRLKFETCYKLKLGVNNVDIFVDKYVYRHKIGGILLCTWENFSGQLMMLCLLVGCGSGLLGVIQKCEQNDILYTFLAGVISAGLLISFDLLMNLKQKKTVLLTNIRDYLENFLKISIENEALSATLIEQYHNEVVNLNPKQIRKQRAIEQAAQHAKTSKSEETSSLKELKKDSTEQLAKERREAKKNELRKMIQEDKKSHTVAKKSDEHMEPVQLKKSDIKPSETKEIKNKKTKYVMTEQEEKIVEEILKEYLA